MSSRDVFELIADLEIYVSEIDRNVDSYDIALATCSEIKVGLEPFSKTMPTTALIVLNYVESIEARIQLDRRG